MSRVLIIDDNYDMLSMLKMILERQGEHEVIAFGVIRPVGFEVEGDRITRRHTKAPLVLQITVATGRLSTGFDFGDDFTIVVAVMS